MNAEEIILAPPRGNEDEQPKASQKSDSERNVPIPITEAELEELKQTATVVVQDGLKIYNAPKNVADLTDIPLRICCHCARFDLNIPEERSAYADIKNYAESPTSDIQLGWEEHAKDGVQMVIYLTYFEYLRARE